MASATLYREYHIEDCARLSQINRREILRYAGAGNNAENNSDFVSIMEECIDEALPVLSYRVSYRIEDSSWKDEYDSVNLNANLEGCELVVLFAATVGIGIDRLISKYSRVSPSKALFMQAFGAERIEALCDAFEESIKNGKLLQELSSFQEDCCIVLHPRFSPGYGDLPLEAQKTMFSVLDCERRLGLTLNESLLMSPSKSVTAIIGVERRCESLEFKSNEKNLKHSKCMSCSKYDCEYRELRSEERLKTE